MMVTNVDVLRNLRSSGNKLGLKAKRLSDALMLDGAAYDGRHKLVGDIEFARQARADVADPQTVAQFLQITLDTYSRGRELGTRLTMK